MRDFRDAKAMAQSLREALKAKSVSLTHSESLELVARTLGLPDWNVLAARIQASQPAATQSGASAQATVPSSTLAGAEMPILALRDLVLFPQMVAPIFIGREKSTRAVERAMATDRRLLVVTQRRAGDDDPALDALFPVGVAAGVVNCLTQPDGTLKLFVSGPERAAIIRPIQGEFLAAEVAPIKQTRDDAAEAVNLSRAVLNAYQTYANTDFSLLPTGPRARFSWPNTADPGVLADSVAPLLSIGIDQRQQLLETSDVVTRRESNLDLMKVSGQRA